MTNSFCSSKVFGHQNVAVLDGGFAKWEREQRPIESGAAAAATVR